MEEIAEDSAKEAFKRLSRPVFVEDAGLFIDALKGFPGTYSGWVFGKIGAEGILRLLEGQSGRSARFVSCIAYHDGEKIRIFKGICEGSISESMRGKSGFGYDPIFIPVDGKQTFSESIILKNKLSHRYISLLEFQKYLREQSR